MSATVREILVIVALVLLNGVFAMAEVAVISARRSRLRQRADAGDARAREALALAENPSQFLSTVQVGITLIGIFAGAYGGAMLAARLAEVLGRVPFLAPYREAVALFLVVAAITYLSLVLGELAPKRLGLSRPEAIAAALARPMRWLARVAAPVVHLLSASTELLLRLLPLPPAEPPVTEEEVRSLIAEGARAGVFQAQEEDVVARVFRLADERVAAVMTPRPDIEWLDLADPPEVQREKALATTHSRLLVARENLDNLVGVVEVKEILARCCADEPLDLEALCQQPPIVPESVPALRVVEQFKASGAHLAVVIDEYGGLQGLVTATDILEALVGEMPEVERGEEREIVYREDGSVLLDAALSIGEVKEVLKLRELPGEREGLYHTLGGFLLTQMGRIPATGEQLVWNGVRFEILDMDGRRIDKVLAIPEGGAAPLAPPDRPSESAAGE